MFYKQEMINMYKCKKCLREFSIKPVFKKHLSNKNFCDGEIEQHMYSIDELKEKLYKKYSRKEISKKMKLSPVQISRLLNKKSSISLKQYIELEKIL